ncbi:MAG: DUF998 domain-containing protein, partial [Phycisphaerae bacterium]|nr:DUF998 domain-containing protein [Gemmatimonadaceae bacterium]
FYLAVGVIQGLVRDGFSFSRHSLSVLANGAGGWAQTANFVLTGLMVIAAAVGFWRMPAPRLRASSVFLGIYGACVFVAAIFRADPADGFPIGTPLGMPTTMTTMGMLHFVVGTLGFVCFAISGFCAVRPMSKRGEESLARLSLLSGLCILLGFFGGFFIPGLSSPVAGIWFAVVFGWVWLSVLSLRLYRLAPSPNC